MERVLERRLGKRERLSLLLIFCERGLAWRPREAGGTAIEHRKEEAMDRSIDRSKKKEKYSSRRRSSKKKIESQTKMFFYYFCYIYVVSG